MTKKTPKAKQRFADKNLVHIEKGGNKKNTTILPRPMGKKQVDESASDGSAGSFSATENIQQEED